MSLKSKLVIGVAKGTTKLVAKTVGKAALLGTAKTIIAVDEGVKKLSKNKEKN